MGVPLASSSSAGRCRARVALAVTWCPKPTVPDTFGLVSPVTPGPSKATTLTLLNSEAGRARPALPVPPTKRKPPEDAFAADGRSPRWADHREARRAELVRIAR